ncbi:MAG: dolichol-phosphate mannosyltransferase [Gaiellaceae bacterium]|nr:dolichol-phosphate mannosyltransferase [Gaiellaceae bacterium]
MPKAVVCLPTYNERENLERMIDALAPLGVGVLVIDDNSPDGTGAIADELAATRDWVSVLHRTAKEGLGRAYIAGFREVLATDAAYVMQMDCDFSHDPAEVPRLIAAVDAGADVAIGSRYVAGGGTSNWGLHRRLMSLGASFFIRLILMPVRDATGGFKCFRREVLEAIDLDSIDAAGYVFQVETTFRARRKGFRVVEVPIHFADRTAGTSKMNFAVALEGIWKVPLLRLSALMGRL